MSFGFGAAAPSQPSFGAPTSQSLFGAQPQSQSLFGASSQSLFAASSQSLFSSQPLFASSQSLFGAQPQSQSLFANTQSASLFALPPSLFASAPQSAPSLFSSQPSLFPQQLQPQPPAPPQLPRPLTDLIERLNPLHPESQFHAALYNIVPPSDIPRYTRPQTMDQKLWDDAVANNPDPSRLVPVQANNFDDLLQRAHMQTARIESHSAVLARLESNLAAMHDGLDRDVRPKLAAFRRRHRELARKLLRVASRVEAAASAGALTPSEAERKRRLEAVEAALNAPAEFKDKLADLVELADATVLGRAAAPSVEIRDPRAAAVIKDLLTDQFRGIEHLAGVCERDERDVAIMSDALQTR